MFWFLYALIYCIVCVMAVLFIRWCNGKDSTKRKFGLKEWIVLILIAPLAIILSPFWFPYILYQHYFSEGKEEKKRRKERLNWQKEYTDRSIISGALSDSLSETLHTYRCKECGYIVQSLPVGYFELKSIMYYNFKCTSCKNIVSITPVDLTDMGYVPYCPQCYETHCLSFWNPDEGHCPKCGGRMELYKSASANSHNSNL